MKTINNEKGGTTFNGEKPDFMYVQHPASEKPIIHILSDNTTLKDWGFISYNKYRADISNMTEGEMKWECYQSLTVRRIVILYRFIKWLFKKQ